MPSGDGVAKLPMLPFQNTHNEIVILSPKGKGLSLSVMSLEMFLKA